jgi:hypothetical protein
MRAAAGASTVSTTYASNQAAIMAANGMTDTEIAAVLAQQNAGQVAVTTAGGTAAGASWVPIVGWATAALAASMDAYAKGYTQNTADSKFLRTVSPQYHGYDVLSMLGVNDKWANILSGSSLMALTWGRSAPKVEAQGVMGAFGNGGFSGQAFADIKQKGGWFRSDKNWTETSALPTELSNFLDTAAKTVMEKAADFGKALGLPVDAIAKVTSDIKVTLTDDAAKNQEALKDALSGYGEALVAGWADAVKPLALYGETTATTIQRVAGAITDVNDVLGALGMQALAASIDGGKAATALEAVFGGIDTLRQTASQYLQDYFTQAERANLATGEITKALAGVGLSMPATRDAFRALVEAQDLTTDSGQKAFEVLMSVESAFADLVPAARSAADILAERTRLEDELLNLQGDTVAIRARERAQLDASNQSLYDQIQALK